jgi:hypothetical protein
MSNEREIVVELLRDACRLFLCGNFQPLLLAGVSTAAGFKADLRGLLPSLAEQNRRLGFSSIVDESASLLAALSAAGREWGVKYVL